MAKTEVINVTRTTCELDVRMDDDHQYLAGVSYYHFLVDHTNSVVTLWNHLPPALRVDQSFSIFDMLLPAPYPRARWGGAGISVLISLLCTCVRACTPFLIVCR